MLAVENYKSREALKDGFSTSNMMFLSSEGLIAASGWSRWEREHTFAKVKTCQKSIAHLFLLQVELFSLSVKMAVAALHCFRILQCFFILAKLTLSCVCSAGH